MRSHPRHGPAPTYSKAIRACLTRPSRQRPSVARRGRESSFSSSRARRAANRRHARRLNTAKTRKVDGGFPRPPAGYACRRWSPAGREPGPAEMCFVLTNCRCLEREIARVHRERRPFPSPSSRRRTEPSTVANQWSFQNQTALRPSPALSNPASGVKTRYPCSARRMSGRVRDDIGWSPDNGAGPRWRHPG